MPSSSWSAPVGTSAHTVRPMRAVFLVLAFVVVASIGVVVSQRTRPHVPVPSLGPRTLQGDTPSVPSGATRSTVTRVVDGDTVVLSDIDVGYLDHRTGGRVARLIGIDTPEVYG